jgi:beta-galactosidase
LVKGYISGKEVITGKVQTSDEASVIKLIPDRKDIRADRQDVTVITVRIEDEENRFVPTAGNQVTFTIEGPGKIIGVGNGDPASHEYKLDSTVVHQGKNEYVIVARPLLKQNTCDELNTYPGTVKVVYPAGKWQRRVFNGLAQVIVQSTQTPGIITLKASADGLTPASAVIITE